MRAANTFFPLARRLQLRVKLGISRAMKLRGETLAR